MIEVCRDAAMASLIAVIAPLGAGWLWAGVESREGATRLSLGLTYWLGLMSLGVLVFFGYGIRLPQTVVFLLGGMLSAIGWISRLIRIRSRPVAPIGNVWWLLPLALGGIGYCVLDPVHDWDAQLIWLARVRLLQEWIPIERFRALEILQPGYPFLGFALWWWVERAAGVSVDAGRVVFLFAYLAFFLAVLKRENAEQHVWIGWLWIAARTLGSLSRSSTAIRTDS